jgi:hypothetical protein
MQKLDHIAWPEHIRENIRDTPQKDLEMRAHVAAMSDSDMEVITAIIDALRRRYPALNVEFTIG